MPLVVPCPGCPTKLSAPESAAGKQIRCPKCKTVVAVPAPVAAEEVPIAEAMGPSAPQPAPEPATVTTVCCIVCNTFVSVLARVKVVHCPKCGFANRSALDCLNEPNKDDEGEGDAPPKKKSRRDEEEDEGEKPRKKKKRPIYDDDDEEDEKPLKKKRKAATGDGSRVVVVLVVVGGLLLLGGVGYGIYALVGKGGVFAKKAPVPAGWKEYRYPQDGFKAYFPNPPVSLVNNRNPMRFGGALGGFPGMNEARDIESVSVYSCGDGLFGNQAGGTSVTVTVAQFRNGAPRSLRNDVNRVNNTQSRRVRWLGYDASELVMGNTVMRIVYTDRALITVQLVGPNGQRVTTEEENGFFDNFEFIK